MDNLRGDLFDSLVDQNLAELSQSDCDQRVTSYLNSIKHYKNSSQLREVSNKLNDIKNLECLNTNFSLDFQNELKGRLVLIDFWTYCCINCMHIIPLLNQIEQEFDNLVVIGVHSSKFLNEKSKQNVLDATRRHLIKHPVVCDFDMNLWSSLNIVCWPTLLVVDPAGLIIAEFRGEVQANSVKKFIQSCFKYYSSELSSSEILLSSQPQETVDSVSVCQNTSSLNFPTKMIHFDGSLFISDSGNNRILCVDSTTNKIKYQIGSGVRGSDNGSFENCSFDWPQGLAMCGNNKLYIADTFNDMIREADLTTRQVVTVCGIKSTQSVGHYDVSGGKTGLEQAISSPWDVCVYETLSGSHVLFIACAGTHQIWLYSLSSGPITWWKNAQIDSKILIAIAGNGKERNKNNSYPMQASFAQPSGLCLSGQILYIADAESSSIRLINLIDGSVKGLAGGNNLQPDDLFAYGDTDGKLNQARFQHPLDVKWISKSNQLVIADTYNNSLRIINLTDKTVSTMKLSQTLSEPNSVCFDEESDRMWIADTNNHRILVVTNLNLTDSDLSVQDFSINFDKLEEKLEIMSMNESLRSSVLVWFDFKLNKSAQNIWKVKCEFNDTKEKLQYEDELNEKQLVQFDQNNLYRLGSIRIDDPKRVEKLKLELSLVYCESDLVCKMLKKKLSFKAKDLQKLVVNDPTSPIHGSILIKVEK